MHCLIVKLFFENRCGSSSVDRALPCQGKGRGFESRLPLQQIVHVEADGHLVTVEVQDTGKGIPPDNLPLVRNQGYSTKDGGFGLGLYYAQKLMDDNQGHLEIESEVNKGTKVALNFPQRPAPSWHCSEI